MTDFGDEWCEIFEEPCEKQRVRARAPKWTEIYGKD